MMVLIYLDKRRKFAVTNILRTAAARGKRAAGRQMGDIRRKAGNLVQLFSLFVSRVGNAF